MSELFRPIRLSEHLRSIIKRPISIPKEKLIGGIRPFRQGATIAEREAFIKTADLKKSLGDNPFSFTGKGFTITSVSEKPTSSIKPLTVGWARKQVNATALRLGHWAYGKGVDHARAFNHAADLFAIVGQRVLGNYQLGRTRADIKAYYQEIYDQSHSRIPSYIIAPDLWVKPGIYKLCGIDTSKPDYPDPFIRMMKSARFGDYFGNNDLSESNVNWRGW